MASSLDPEKLLALIPEDGTSIGNFRLRELLSKKLGNEVSLKAYVEVRDALLARGAVATGSGRGGSVRRVVTDEKEDLALTMPEAIEAPQKNSTSGSKSKKKSSAKKLDGNASEVLSYRHDQKRRNNPEVGMVDPDSDPGEAKTSWAYDPHIDPTLQFDIKRAEVELIIDNALASGDEGAMRDALATLKRMAQPYLTWAGKAERTSFEVDTVSLHVHERIDPATILAGIRRRMTKKGEEKVTQRDLFRAWFEEPLPYHKAVEFYKHDRGWANRLISGDSLLVMNSLLQKEGMAGQVQMIYLDPPYGIKYGSNFQPFVNKRDVKDRKDEDLTQEPEMIKAFRDTWELGIHSYLTYLRDRLLLAKGLLHESGSVFVQIGDENEHLVRNLLDDVFGAENFCAQVVYQKAPYATSTLLPPVYDTILWYARSKSGVKYRALFIDEQSGGVSQTGDPEASDPASQPSDAEFASVSLVSPGPSTKSQSFHHNGVVYLPPENSHWKTTLEGLQRAGAAGRLYQARNSLRFKSKADDFAVGTRHNIWTDTITGSFTEKKVFIVQTNPKVIERCLLMTTDPGDLVLDPTCGSGTTALVAERWGRRWITCDTSRVAVTLAKQRLMTASYDYYELRYPNEGLTGAFVYKTVPHVTLGSIANNTEIDEIWDRMHPAVLRELERLNTALGSNPPDPFEIAQGGRSGSTVDFRSGNSRTVELLSSGRRSTGALFEWEVPLDFPKNWPSESKASFEAFHQARIAMQRQMDASIASHADSETLYDQPQVAEGKLRVTGPFTVEAVPFPSVLALNDPRHPENADTSIARSGESARQHNWRDELLKTGIRGKGGQTLGFAQLETLPGTKYLHCTGTLASTGERVVVSFGPEHAALEQRQVELAMREAGEVFPRPRMIVFCAFAFDPEAAKDIDATKGIISLKAQMNTDLLTEDLKKARASNQSFWLMGQPDVDVRQRKDGRYEVEVNGFDYFDTAKGELVSGGKGKIAAWALDTDYDERSLFPRQVFFPMAGAKDGWQKLKKEIKAELDEALLAKLHSTVSLPFKPGENKKVAVKIVDDRGIESLKVISLL